MIQILGLRANPSTNKLMHSFFDQNWRAESIPMLFENLDQHVALIPEEERYNMFFTLANTLGARPRDFYSQSFIPLDIDGCVGASNVEDARIEAQGVVEAVCLSLGVDFEACISFCSGFGVWILIEVDPWTDIQWFKQSKKMYKHLCEKVNKALLDKGIKGEADPSIWDQSRIARLPLTQNRKEKGIRDTFVINSKSVKQSKNLNQLADILIVEPKSQISYEALRRFPTPDQKYVLKECLFIKHCGDNQHLVSEPEWAALHSIFGALPDGEKLIHQYSKKHPKYSPEETSAYFERAKLASGPRTCDNVSTLSDKCKSCPHFGKIKSPILLQGPDFIKTKSTGFYDVFQSNGKVSKRPNYDDLLKHFKKKYPYFVNPKTAQVYRYLGTYWEEFEEPRIIGFAEKSFEPKPSRAMRAEFSAKVKANNLREMSWVEHSTSNKINLQNGVFDFETNELLDHADKYFFQGILPYEYDPFAKAPKFLKFMEEITCGDAELKQVLLEFSGYAVSGDECWEHKALMLHGSGRNGKSTFMEVLKALVGPGLYSTLSLNSLEDDRKRQGLEGKMFNVGEETNVHALNRSEYFKTLVSGGEVDVRRLYMQPYTMRNKAKMIFACNSLPYSNDTSDGLYRRLVIVPFNAVFEGEVQNKNLKNELMSELPGIFNIVLKAYKEMKKRAGLFEAKVVSEELERFKMDNDTVIAWFDEYVTITRDSSDFVATKELYASYKEEMFSLGTKFYVTHIEFSRKLNKVLNRFVSGETIKESRRVRGGKNLRGYAGVKLTSEEF